MAGQICPHCGANEGVSRYGWLRVWLGLLMYLGGVGIALWWGVVWGISRTNPLMGDVRFGGVFVGGSIVFTYLLLVPLVLWVYLEPLVECTHCHHRWVMEPVRVSEPEGGRSTSE